MIPKVNALILTEGGQKIGFGHITRCCALKEAFRAAGISALLVVNGDVAVRTQFQGQLDQVFNWIKDLKKLLRLIRLADIVVVDSYLAPLGLYKKIAAFVPVPVYIDDYVRLSYPRGIVVSGAIGAENFPYPKNHTVRYLRGVRYALLRKEFWRIPARKVRKEIKDVLISFGGIRRPGFVQKMLAHLSPAFPQWHFHVVLPKGPGSFVSRKNVRFYWGLKAVQMRFLMLRSDMAISGGGQTTNELSTCGLPVIGICFAANQSLNIQGWQKHGVLRCAGSAGCQDIFRRIEVLLKGMNYEKRYAMSSAGRKLIDGKGARRFVKALTSPPLFSLSPVSLRDRRLVYSWSNDPQIRSVSFRTKRIGWVEHCSWFGKRIHIPQSPFYKILWLGRPAGQIRFDRSGKRAKISVSLGRLFRGKGLGVPAIRLASKKFFNETDIHTIDAFVKSRNCSSFKVFRRAGFLPFGIVSIEGQKAHHLVLRKQADD